MEGYKKKLEDEIMTTDRPAWLRPAEQTNVTIVSKKGKLGKLCAKPCRYVPKYPGVLTCTWLASGS